MYKQKPEDNIFWELFFTFTLHPKETWGSNNIKLEFPWQIIISFHFCPDHNWKQWNGGIGVFPQIHTKQSLLSYKILFHITTLRATNIELHLTGLSSRASCGPGIFHIDNRLNTIPSIVILWYNSHKLSITKNSLYLYKLLCFKHASCLLIYNNKILQLIYTYTVLDSLKS